MGYEKRKGRNETPRFVKIPHYIVDSLAFQSLSGGGVQVAVLLIRRFNGSNNGYISLSNREVADLTGMSKNTASRKFIELQEKGFIAVTRKGHFQNRMATTYRLTFEHSFDDYGKRIERTDDWKRYCKKQNKVPDLECVVSPMDT